VRILVVDDEPDVVEVIELTFSLQWPGSEVIAAADGESGLKLFQVEPPDVVILDVGLPGMSGFEVCRRLRAISDVPILMLTVRGEEMERLKGLELGADDYIVKPFSPLELVARTRAVLRRSQAAPLAASSRIIVDEELTLDLDNREVILRGQPVKLTPTECRILSQLVANAGRVVTQKTLLAKVWGWESDDDILMLKVHVARLRQKLGDDAHNPRYIFTERGLGYRFVRPASVRSSPHLFL
jgi:two-component system KDP operon response regulator KdpE